jgi:hypothetical protein
VIVPSIDHLERFVVGPEDNVRDLSKPVRQTPANETPSEWSSLVSSIRATVLETWKTNDSEWKQSGRHPWSHSPWMKGPIRTMAYMPLSWISLKNLTMSYRPSKLY